MRNSDMMVISKFNERLERARKADEASVIAFLTNHEINAQGECKFTQMISERITALYEIAVDDKGWSHQIGLVAGRVSLSWVATYLWISSDILLPFMLQLHMRKQH